MLVYHFWNFPIQDFKMKGSKKISRPTNSSPAIGKSSAAKSKTSSVGGNQPPARVAPIQQKPAVVDLGMM